MAKSKTIDYFQKIVIPDPVDVVIGQIRGLIQSGQLKPGDKLPSERRLEEKIGVPRGSINRAMRMMETYGIVNVIPQNGTYIADICVEALDGLIANVTTLQSEDFDSLADVRLILELHATELMVKNATDADIAELEAVHSRFAEDVRTGNLGFDKDLVFHLKIAVFSKNQVLNSVLTKLAVNMIDLLKTFETEISEELLTERLNAAVKEHTAILEALKARDVEAAKAAVRQHFDTAVDFNHKHRSF